jgi:hypothetical protein
MNERPRATVRKIEGQLVLDDPDAVALVRAVSKHNCRNTLKINADRVEHFKRRLTERGLTPTEAVIVLLNLNDPNGGQIAEVLMPGHNWQEYRDRGEVPFVRGLVMREGIEGALNFFDKEAADKLREMTEAAVVVVDHGVAEIFPA